MVAGDIGELRGMVLWSFQANMKNLQNIIIYISIHTIYMNICE